MRPVAFLTSVRLDEFVTYDHLAIEPLAARGWAVEMVPWQAPTDWSRFRAVVVRSPWDYQAAPEAFLRVLGEIEASAARLANPLAVAEWNLHKRYLRDLEALGVRTVPTAWSTGIERLEPVYDRFGTDELVAKPAVGAGAEDTFRLRRSDAAARAEARRVLAGREVMVQPFVDAVVDEGEVSVFAFGGRVSHAVLKTPARGDFRVQEEHGGVIRAHDPEPELAAAAVHALAVTGPLLYARADFVRMPDRGWALIELELVEPSLYFPFDPASPERFAAAFDAWMAAPETPWRGVRDEG